MEYFFLSEGRWKVWTCFDITCYLSCLGFDCVTCPLPAEALACTCSLFTLLVGCQSSHLRGGIRHSTIQSSSSNFNSKTLGKTTRLSFATKSSMEAPSFNRGRSMDVSPASSRDLIYGYLWMFISMGRRFHTVRCDINIRFMMFHT